MGVCSEFSTERWNYYTRCSSGVVEILISPVSHQLLYFSSAKHNATALSASQTPGDSHLEVLHWNLAECINSHSQNNICSCSQMQVSVRAKGWLSSMQVTILAELVHLSVLCLCCIQCLSQQHGGYLYCKVYTLLDNIALYWSTWWHESSCLEYMRLTGIPGRLQGLVLLKMGEQVLW